MTALPPEISPEDEIEVQWEHTEHGTKVTAILGEASIVLESSEAAAPTVPWLVAALPSILEAAWAAIEAEEEKS